MVRKRIALAQNFLRDPRLVSSIVRRSSISPDDVVVEIGPGEGILTKELAKIAKKVIAVERDYVLSASLKRTFSNSNNVEIHNADFLTFHVNEPRYRANSFCAIDRTGNEGFKRESERAA